MGHKLCRRVCERINRPADDSKRPDHFEGKPAGGPEGEKVAKEAQSMQLHKWAFVGKESNSVSEEEGGMLPEENARNRALEKESDRLPSFGGR